MQRVHSSTAYHDVTYNNVKASRASMNDIFSQNITKITSDRENPVEVFSTLARLETMLTSQNTTMQQRITELTERNTELLQRINSLETRINELVTDDA